MKIRKVSKFKFSDFDITFGGVYHAVIGRNIGFNNMRLVILRCHRKECFRDYKYIDWKHHE